VSPWGEEQHGDAASGGALSIDEESGIQGGCPFEAGFTLGPGKLARLYLAGHAVDPDLRDRKRTQIVVPRRMARSIGEIPHSPAGLCRIA
jgi:hypothetical protein